MNKVQTTAFQLWRKKTEDRKISNKQELRVTAVKAWQSKSREKTHNCLQLIIIQVL